MSRNTALILSVAGVLSITSTLNAQDGAGGFDDDISSVETDEFDTFNIQVQDTELVKVLEMLALQSERNIIPSRNVASVVSVNLFDVTFSEALDAILTPNGFGFEETPNGKFIYVYTAEELERKQQKERITEARMFELEHLSASDASEFAKPLISDRGRLSFIGDVEGGIERDFSNMGRDDWAHSALLVVNDYPENLAKIAELLNEIDTPPKQVVIDATIASVLVTEDDAFGVDFSVIGSLDYTSLLNPLSAVTDMLRGSLEPEGNYNNVAVPVYEGTSQAVGVSSTAGNVKDGKGNFKVGVMMGDAGVFLRALDEVQDTMILARPRLMALNRQRAQVLVGERVAYLSTTSTDTTTTQTVQYLDTGVKLMFRPFISNDGSIRMELYPSVSNAKRTQITAGAEAILVPDEFTNEITTNVRVRDGETLVLGGLFKEENQIINSQVPFLGDVPILGAAFSGYDNTIQRKEIIFLITPTIVHDDLVKRSGELGQEFVRELRVGMREGLLPWSRERRSAQHNQNAIEAINNDDFELAMFHIDNSLRLNSAQPKIKHLRRQIGEQGDLEYYDADMWDSALADMMRKHRKASNDAKLKNPEKDPLAPTEQPVVDAEDAAAATTEKSVSGITITSNSQHEESVNVSSLLDEIDFAEERAFAEMPVVAAEVKNDASPAVEPITEPVTETMPFVSMMNATEVAGSEPQGNDMSVRPVQPAMKKLWWLAGTAIDELNAFMQSAARAQLEAEERNSNLEMANVTDSAE
jgi:type IV pilus assembly protein PilQ